MNKSNILTIVLDQLRFDCVGFSELYPVKTPNLDALSRKSTYFSNCYTTSPLCCPARQTMINGRRAEVFGGLWNFDITLPIPALNKDEYSYARQLSENGYRTGYIGKWHVNPNESPLSFGYEYYYNDWSYRAHRTEVLKVPLLKGNPHGEIDPIDVENSRTHFLAGKAIEKIDEYSSEINPWHIRLDLSEPHLPCTPVQQFMDMYDVNSIPKWASFDDDFNNKPYIQKQQLYNWNMENYTWDDWKHIVHRYYAMITQVDDAIGTVLKAVNDYGCEENTIIMFTSDHGDMCGGHRMYDKHYIMYEDVVKVPLIIYSPLNDMVPHVDSNYVYNTLDWAPTIIDFAGLELPDHFQGKSLKPLLSGEINEFRSSAVSAYNGQQFGLFNQRMIVKNGIKYIWNPTDIDELYDLKEDEGELVNQIDNVIYKDCLADLRKELYEVLTGDGDRLLAGDWFKRQLLEGVKISSSQTILE